MWEIGLREWLVEWGREGVVVGGEGGGGDCIRHKCAEHCSPTLKDVDSRRLKRASQKNSRS